jgi:hypothetical protein
MAESLCEACRFIDIKSLLQPSQHRILYDTTTLTVSHIPANPENTDCSFCKFVARCIDFQCSLGHTTRPSEHSSGILQRVELCSALHGYTETFEGSPTDSYCLCVRYSGIVCRILPFGENAFRLGCRKQSFARNLNLFEAERSTLKSWVRVCREMHAGPCLEQDRKYGHGYSSDIMRLVDTVNECVVSYNSSKHEYVALSYVWGGTKQLLLYSGNVVQMSQSGALRTYSSEVSKTICDAMTITRELGFQYLWVDTLCICQDDTQEKESQIASMNEIYKHAMLTLVALDSKDASSGLHGVGPYSKPRSRPVTMMQGLRLTLIGSPLSSVLESSKWKKRAWTFGEDQFSRRALYFSQEQAYFRCLQSLMSEDTWPEDVAIHRGAEKRVFFDYRNYEYLLWDSLLTDFSTRQFTFAIDRLDAFQGVVKEIASRYTYPFLCGLPVKDLSDGLLWRTIGVEALRNTTYPSWSWCGWSGGVQNSSKASGRIRIRDVFTDDDELIYSCNHIAEDALFPISTLRTKNTIRRLYYIFGNPDGYKSKSCLDFKSLHRLPGIMPATVRRHQRDREAFTQGRERHRTDPLQVKHQSRLAICAFVINTRVNLQDTVDQSNTQSLTATVGHVTAAKLPPICLWLDAQTSVGREHSISLSFLLIKTTSSETQPRFTITELLTQLWESLRETWVGQYISILYELACFVHGLVMGLMRPCTRVYAAIFLAPTCILTIAGVLAIAVGIAPLPFFLFYIGGLLIWRSVFALRSIFSNDIDTSSTDVQMLIIKPKNDDMYERIGMAEWKEDAFVFCNPETRYVILE